MKLGKDTNSLINHCMSTAKSETPAVGMGATILMWSDRRAGTIIACSDSEFTVQADNVRRADKNGISENQEYEYSPNPNGIRYVFKKVSKGCAKGQWRENGSEAGQGVLIGHRDHYHDFSS